MLSISKNKTQAISPRIKDYLIRHLILITNLLKVILTVIKKQEVVPVVKLAHSVLMFLTHKQTK